MAYVIAEPCQDVKDGACVEACPVDCIRQGSIDVGGIVRDQFFINPGDCINCRMCELVCPVGAIYKSNELPKRWREYIDINADFFESGTRIG